MGTPPLKWSQFKNRERWMVSPHLTAWQKKILTEIKPRVPHERGLIWILSSGTKSVSTLKCIGLHYDAFMASAQAVNRHLESDRSDKWLLALPTFHVGGLSIYTRAFLSRAKVSRFEGKWSAEKFSSQIEKEKITLTSMVPTQVFDLVQAGKKCPRSLRAAVIGGGALSARLYLRARELGWPLLPSYGLTECCSQIATAALDSLRHEVFPDFSVLSHAEVKLSEGRVLLRAESMCKWLAVGFSNGMISVQVPGDREGWLRTEDLGEWHDGKLRIQGRRDDVLKVLGELVSIPDIEAEARQFFTSAGLKGDVAVIARPSERKENELMLFTDSPDSLKEWANYVEEFNRQQPGVRRLSGPFWVTRIPRGDLGKVKRAELMFALSLS